MGDTKLTKMIKAIVRETISKTWVSQHGIDGIISDNRLGVLVKSSPLYLSLTNYK
jgi:hypothetical protein